jgi:hypothetical protein
MFNCAVAEELTDGLFAIWLGGMRGFKKFRVAQY